MSNDFLSFWSARIALWSFFLSRKCIHPIHHALRTIFQQVPNNSPRALHLSTLSNTTVRNRPGLQRICPNQQRTNSITKYMLLKSPQLEITRAAPPKNASFCHVPEANLVQFYLDRFGKTFSRCGGTSSRGAWNMATVSRRRRRSTNQTQKRTPGLEIESDEPIPQMNNSWAVSAGTRWFCSRLSFRGGGGMFREIEIRTKSDQYGSPPWWIQSKLGGSWI